MATLNHFIWRRPILVSQSNARIRIIVPQIVPFPLPLSEPPITPEFTAQRIQGVLSSYRINVEVQVCLCRERLDAAISVLSPHSLILIGGRRRFWRTKEDRLVQVLRHRGPDVVFVEEERDYLGK